MCVAVRWCIAVLVVCVRKQQDSSGVWWWFGVLCGRWLGQDDGLILGVFLLFTGGLLAWLPVLGNRRIQMVIGGGLV